MIGHHELTGPAGAPPLLLINSLGADLSMWDPQVDALSAEFRVIRYDARGHGASAVPEGRYALADLGRDALDLLDHLGIARAHVCGLSLGGMTGMWLAAHAPDRVDRLILCCTSALLGPKSMWAGRAATVLRDGTGAIADAAVRRWVTPGFAAAHPRAVARLREMVAATPPVGYAGACAAIEDLDLRADLARITAPTLVIAGADDPATPPAHGAAIAAGIAGARFEVLSPAAHLATYEQPETVNRILLEALR
ncbi:3-oxoadipate enol-lactonase [Actinoplanes sp. N902-109]|uniref:3-oxoadipate enol-lactonase n=1 Tax=Actinoplanes sp. (strain N902-109) TaxID=649831 RepID=UPI000329404B|nr:3-oxoadipate enol-lactonase [Actinoplanes sp. N902-109]AGL17806.1 3-oxoadipate enol-lactonase [Actinoplanes sp. N902-109]